MNQRNALLVMFFMIIVAFVGLVAYDMHTNNRLDTLLNQQQKTNYPWDDNWNGVKPVEPHSDAKPPDVKPEIKEQITASSYQDALKKSGELGMPVFVYFEADWCSWCRKMKSETLSNAKVRLVLKNYVVVYVNTDKDRQIASKHGVRSLPSYLITNYKEESLKKDSGFQDAESFESWLNNPNLYQQEKAPEGRVKPENQKPDRRWPERQPRQQPG